MSSGQNQITTNDESNDKKFLGIVHGKKYDK